MKKVLGFLNGAVVLFIGAAWTGICLLAGMARARIEANG